MLEDRQRLYEHAMKLTHTHRSTETGLRISVAGRKILINFSLLFAILVAECVYVCVPVLEMTLHNPIQTRGVA